jgi:hypothetical protein
MKRDSNGDQRDHPKASRRPGEAAVGDGLDHGVPHWNQGPAVVKWRHVGGGRLGWPPRGKAFATHSMARPFIDLGGAGTWMRWTRWELSRWKWERRRIGGFWKEGKRKRGRGRGRGIPRLILDRQIGQTRNASRAVRAEDLKGPVLYGDDVAVTNKPIFGPLLSQYVLCETCRGTMTGQHSMYRVRKEGNQYRAARGLTNLHT